MAKTVYGVKFSTLSQETKVHISSLHAFAAAAGFKPNKLKLDKDQMVRLLKEIYRFELFPGLPLQDAFKACHEEITKLSRRQRKKLQVAARRRAPTIEYQVVNRTREEPIKIVAPEPRKLDRPKPERQQEFPAYVPSKEQKAEFYASWDWRTLRMEAFKMHGHRCQCCGAAPGMTTVGGELVRLVVDHIKPLSKYWELRLKLDNLQILCEECNMGKGNWDETDYRAAPLDPLQRN